MLDYSWSPKGDICLVYTEWAPHQNLLSCSWPCIPPSKPFLQELKAKTSGSSVGGNFRLAMVKTLMYFQDGTSPSLS